MSEQQELGLFCERCRGRRVLTRTDGFRKYVTPCPLCQPLPTPIDRTSPYPVTTADDSHAENNQKAKDAAQTFLDGRLRDRPV